MASRRATKASKRRAAKQTQAEATERIEAPAALPAELAVELHHLAAERGTTASELLADLVRSELKTVPPSATGSEAAAEPANDAAHQHPALRLTYDAARIGQAWSRVATEHEHEAYELVREYTAAPEAGDAAERVVSALDRWQRQPG